MKYRCVIIELILVLVSTSRGYICDRTPKNVGNPNPNIDKYVLEVVGNPPSYSPSQTYTIILKSNPSNPIDNYFTEFMLVVEPEIPSESLQTVSTGELSPVDESVTTFTPKCPNAVVQTNNLAKLNLEVKWRAPSSGNGCVAIKAMVYESSDSWFIDDGGLTKILCEEEENLDVQSPPLDKCDACGEAKYEIAFQGTWTRNTHPKDYPSNMWSTKLSDVIGASHKLSKSFWSYTEKASDGLKLLAEDGDTGRLEDELKEMSGDIRTIIKARELSYPNITGTSYTVFRVDQENHLISLVSKITPSPDWIVGVANLELCLPGGKWVQNRNLNLYPWDVGTDDGVSYNSPDSPSSPRKVISRISGDDEDSPFYRENGNNIKPIAKLQIKRQKLYEKFCEAEEEIGEEDDSCKLSEWSHWSNCSTTCGQEVMTRDRQLLKPENEEQCTKDGPLELQQTVRCTDSVECEISVSECINATFSDWSSCSVTCGDGTKTRHRVILSDENVENETTPQNEESESCVETVSCYNPPCEETEVTTNNDIITQVDSQVFVLNEGPSYLSVVDCKVSKWSEWSSCSATEPCTRGYRFKERHIEIHARNGGKACPRRLQKARHCEVPCTKNESSEQNTHSESSTERRRFYSGETVDCKMGPWSEWSPCSSNCGSSAVQQRTRIVEVRPSKYGRKCESRIEERKCSLPYACSDRESLFLNIKN